MISSPVSFRSPRLMATTSETRIPVEYKVSRIARSRAPRMSVSSGAESNRSICSTEMAFGRRLACLGVRIRTIGLVGARPLRSIHLWKLRSVAILRAMVAAEYFCSPSLERNSRINSTSHFSTRPVIVSDDVLLESSAFRSFSRSTFTPAFVSMKSTNWRRSSP